MSRTRTRTAVTLAALSLSLVGIGAAPATAQARAPYDLTPRQEAVVLDLIDDICGDTWCEGDFAFDFRRFECSPEKRSCVLRLRIASWANDPLEWQWRSRQITGFPRFWQMVDTSDSGYLSLDWDFYTAVSDAISSIEESVR